jgi:serine/threonine protein kinase
MNAMGYVHCDVKPDNILVNAIGDTKIIDFAISKKIPTGLSRWFYRKGKPQGTPSFMCPEQILGHMPDPSFDIYSYGCTLYELSTGRPPFRGATRDDLLTRHFKEKPAPLFTYNPDVTEEFSAFVLKLLGKTKKDRPKNFHEVLIELRKVQQIYKSMPERHDEEH